MSTQVLDRKGTLTLSFADDMPPAVVEIVAADMHTLGTVLMRPGQSREIDTDEPAHLVCIQMPNGHLVTLPRRDFERKIERRNLRPSPRAESPYAASATAAARQPRPRFGNEVSAASWEEKNLGTIYSPRWEWSMDGGGKSVPDALRWVFAGDSAKGSDLRGKFGKSDVQVRVPGNIRRVSVRDHESAATGVVTIEMLSRSPMADMLLGYLQTSLPAGREAVNEILSDGGPRIVDPFGACVLAYMLLRVRRFDAAAQSVFDAVGACLEADAHVIAAWQLLACSPDRMDDVEAHLVQALARGLPVYTEGVRLLLDGLLMLGAPGREHIARLQDGCRYIVWSSPVTTILNQASSPTPIPRIKVEFTAASSIVQSTN